MPLVTVVVRSVTGWVVVMTVAVRTVPGLEVAKQFGLTIDEELAAGRNIEELVIPFWLHPDEEPVAVD